MLIRYMGHSAFLIKNKEDIRIITDPYSPTRGVNYKPIKEAAEIVTISHEHWDHNAVDYVKGNPSVIKKVDKREVRGIKIRGVSTFHDASEGKERGKNIIFIFEIEGMRLCHLGDLGHVLNNEQISQIGDIDICLIPVGGTFTIGPEEAKKVLEAINPKIVIPMHFKTPSLDFPIAKVDDFLKGIDNVVRVNSSDYEIEKDKLPTQREIIVLNPAMS